jgi:hypothetical protein
VGITNLTIIQQHFDPGTQSLNLNFEFPFRLEAVKLPKLNRLELFTLRNALSP